MAETVHRIVENGIPVMGHIGLTPQSIHHLSGYRVQGKTPKEALELVQDALALEEAGAFSIVLEMVPAPLAKVITERVKVPTIGIGAGLHCDGQVQVISDLLGLFTDFQPKHAKRYAHLAEVISNAVAQYASEVRAEGFPTEKESHAMDPEALAAVMASL